MIDTYLTHSVTSTSYYICYQPKYCEIFYIDWALNSSWLHWVS